MFVRAFLGVAPRAQVVRPNEVLFCVVGFLLLCCVHGPLMRLRGVMVERRHAPARRHDVHEKIASGEIEKPCSCFECPDCCY